MYSDALHDFFENSLDWGVSNNLFRGECRCTDRQLYCSTRCNDWLMQGELGGGMCASWTYMELLSCATCRCCCSKRKAPAVLVMPLPVVRVKTFYEILNRACPYACVRFANGRLFCMTIPNFLFEIMFCQSSACPREIMAWRVGIGSK